MMVGPESPEGPRRHRHHGAWFPAPDALPIRAGANVDRVLQYARNRAVIFWRNEQHRIRGLYLFAKREPGLGRRIIEVLVVQRNLSDLDDLQFHPLRRQRGEGKGGAAIEAARAETTNQDRHFLARAHVDFLLGGSMDKYRITSLSRISIGRSMNMISRQSGKCQSQSHGQATSPLLMGASSVYPRGLGECDRKI